MKEELTPLQRKRRNRTALSIVVFVISVTAIITAITLLVCYVCGVFPTSQYRRRKIAEYYSKDTAYSTITGQAEVTYDGNGIYITVTLDGVSTDNYGGFYTGGKYRYYFVSPQRAAIEENGFKDVLNGPLTDEYDTVYYEVTQPVTVTASNDRRGAGSRPYAVAISVGGREYLSYETGKELLIHYILYEMY